MCLFIILFIYNIFSGIFMLYNIQWICRVNGSNGLNGDGKYCSPIRTYVLLSCFIEFHLQFMKVFELHQSEYREWYETKNRQMVAWKYMHTHEHMCTVTMCIEYIDKKNIEATVRKNESNMYLMSHFMC